MLFDPREREKEEVSELYVVLMKHTFLCVCVCVFFSCSMIPLIFDQDRQQRAFVKKHGFFL